MKKKYFIVPIFVMIILLVIAGCTKTTVTPTTATTLISPGLPPVSTPQGNTSSPGVPTVSGVPAQISSSGASSTISGAQIQSSGFYGGQSQNTGIWVAGEGQVSAAPDIANISLGVQAQALTVADAQANANNAMNAIMLALKNKGVADQDIVTIGFNIVPMMNYKTNTITGYNVSNMATAKIRKIADTGSIIDAASTAGGNFIQVNSISFSVDNPAPYLSQARSKAMADASAKASQLASLAGAKLGAPTYISESSTNYVPYPTSYSSGAAVSAPAQTTSISPGQTQISVTVQVVYAIQ